MSILKYISCNAAYVTMNKKLTGCSTGAQMLYPHHWWRTETSWTWGDPPWGRLLYRAYTVSVRFVS